MKCPVCGFQGEEIEPGVYRVRIHNCNSVMERFIREMAASMKLLPEEVEKAVEEGMRLHRERQEREQ